jgi:hypothetical protein
MMRRHNGCLLIEARGISVHPPCTPRTVGELQFNLVFHKAALCCFPLVVLNSPIPAISVRFSGFQCVDTLLCLHSSRIQYAHVPAATCAISLSRVMQPAKAI